MLFGTWFSKIYKLKTFYIDVKRLRYLTHNSNRKVCCRATEASRSSTNVVLSATTQSSGRKTGIFSPKKYPNTHMDTHTCEYLFIYTHVSIPGYICMYTQEHIYK